ncbi:DUF4150 domain-containing protein [Variovorax sp. dw_308]|uniref:DUF4150 domain-containing protein n=1 Tax=Variovorax sp. dw_308 TaxID=2721546 RepID=UPI001C491CA0|nr:DUF4150 domain-containing protein [Variovorax sp. dw_308]
MSCKVYANGDEIACKSGDGKVIAAFPDVCLTPPPPPAGPLPVPYPNTSFSKDMKEGSKTVQIKGGEVMLKDSSFYKTSPLGDEAATNGQGAGVVTHGITGKTYFVAWSMDVKFEGQNVDRHTDMTTSNHASPTANDEVVATNIGDSASAEEKSDEELCQCCKKHPPHSAAQARGESISEEEFHKPPQTGLRKRSGRGNVPIYDHQPLTPKQLDMAAEAQTQLAKMRKQCPEQVPNNPPQGPCDLYYRVTAKEKQDADKLFAAASDKNNPFKPDDWKGAIMVAHKVPRSGGGCPVGEGNTHGVRNQPCADLDGKLGTLQNEMVTIARDKL